MKIRKIVTSIISVLLIAAALYFLPELYHKITLKTHTLELDRQFYIYTITFELLLSLIGFLSMRNWIEFFLTGKVKIQAVTLIVGIMILVIVVIPPATWVVHFGLRGTVNKLMYTAQIHYPLCLMAGVIIGRSFVHKNDGDSLRSSKTGLKNENA